MKHLIRYNESNSNLTYKFEIVLGDYGGDGHNITERYNILSSLPLNIVKEYYKQASILIGFDLMNYCNDYEQSSIPKEDYENLISLGIIEKNKYENHDHIYTDTYIKILLNMVKQVDSEYLWKIEENNYNNMWDAGGYGLFSN